MGSRGKGVAILQEEVVRARLSSTVSPPTLSYNSHAASHHHHITTVPSPHHHHIITTPSPHHHHTMATSSMQDTAPSRERSFDSPADSEEATGALDLAELEQQALVWSSK